MLIVRYTGPSGEAPNGAGWVMFLHGMEGLLVEEPGGFQVLWREVLIRTGIEEPWRHFHYMPASIEVRDLAVIGYVEDVTIWKHSHISAVPWPPWLKERLPDAPEPRRPRDK